MEFKADEVEAILLSRYWLGRGLPQHGMLSGVGIRNPPGFPLLLLPLAALTSSPLSFGLYVAAFNVAALGLIFLAGRELGSPRAGWWACGFMAAHPWLVLYSRKIWAQSLLPFFVLLFLMVVARVGRRAGSKAIFWAFPLVSLIWQIHYSGYCVLAFFIVWFAFSARSRRVNWRAALAGFVVGAALLLPYLSYLKGNDFMDIRRSFRGRGGGGSEPWENLVGIVRSEAGTAFAGGFGYPFAAEMIPLSRTPPGRESPGLQPTALLSTALILILAGAGVFAGKGRADAAFSRWLFLFTLVPPVLYFIRGIKPPPHYFIVGIPAVLILAGLGMDNLLKWCYRPENARQPGGETGRAAVRRSPLAKFRLASGLLAPIAGMAVIFSGVAIWSSFIRYINRAGGTGGDYGLAYRVQRRASRLLVEERVPPPNIDAALTRDGGLSIRYLVTEEISGHLAKRGSIRKNRTEPEAHDREISAFLNAKNKYARLIDTLLFPGRDCSPYRFERIVRLAGPLKICLADLSPGAGK